MLEAEGLKHPIRGLTDQTIIRILSRADGARFIIVNNYGLSPAAPAKGNRYFKWSNAEREE